MRAPAADCLPAFCALADVRPGDGCIIRQTAAIGSLEQRQTQAQAPFGLSKFSHSAAGNAISG